MITGLILLFTVSLFKIADRKMIALSLIIALVIFALLQIFFGEAWLQYSLSREYSDIERWETIRRGLAMWMESPVFGAGLGVFIEQSTNWSKYPINIHSTPIWILAEFGIVGLAVFTWIISVFIRFLYKQGITRPAHRIIGMLLLGFLIFSLVHEIFYQRIFWLVLGAVMASTGYMNLESKKIIKNTNG
jgi:hypothetical protein